MIIKKTKITRGSLQCEECEDFFSAQSMVVVKFKHRGFILCEKCYEEFISSFKEVNND